MPSDQQPFDHRFIKISEDIQANEDDQALDGILKQLARLQAQVTVQSTLVSTAQILSSHPKNRSLPNNLATRVKHIIKFVYEKSTRNEERSARLRKLDCNALKFCGLTYTIRNLLELPELQFEFLIEYVAQFVNGRGLIQHLYRGDISKALEHEIVPENAQLFREFLLASTNSRPLKRPSIVDKDDSSASNEPYVVLSAEPTLSVSQDSHDVMPPHARPPKRRREITDGALASTEPIPTAPTEQVAQDPPWSLTGEVIKLTIEDVKEAAESNQVGSDINLTWPHNLLFAPFITVPVSNSLALEFVVRGNYPQEM